MSLYLIYPIYTVILMLIVFAAVPRKQIKKLVLYGIIFGAIADVFVIVLLKLIGAGGYLNLGPFGFMGIPFFPPLAWSAFFILLLHFFPEKGHWNYIYVLIAAGYSTFFSNVLENLGIFQWNYGGLVVPYVIYSLWFFSATWYFQNDMKNEEMKMNDKLITNNKKAPNIRLIKNPVWKMNLTYKKEKN